MNSTGKVRKEATVPGGRREGPNLLTNGKRENSRETTWPDESGSAKKENGNLPSIKKNN